MHRGRLFVQRHFSRIAVAMSGGIDSSVCALLLKQQGHEIIGVYMTNWDINIEQPSEQGQCTKNQDCEDMKQVCKTLEIPAYEVNLSKEYWLDVFEPFIDSYKNGEMTPNPDVDCNRYIKFKCFTQYCINKWNVDYVATGHYARLEERKIHNSDMMKKDLLRAIDTTKDQSYFLATTMGHQFEKVLFPIGNMLKSEVRALAHSYFPQHHILTKQESAGICFIGRRRYFASFLEQFFESSCGNFVDVDTGAIIGVHKGKELYTIGQKARIKSMDEKYYVVGRGKANDLNVYVAKGAQHRALYSDYLLANLSLFSWISGDIHSKIKRKCTKEVDCDHKDMHYNLLFKSRYNNIPMPCIVQIICPTCQEITANTQSYYTDDNSSIQSPDYSKYCNAQQQLLLVTFQSPDRAVTPGQIVVLYDGDECLGGGPILHGGVGAPTLLIQLNNLQHCVRSL